MRFEAAIENLSDMIHQQGDMMTMITSITHDSREVSEGSLFVALKGLNTDGHKYIPQALQQGASAIVYDDPAYDHSSFTSIRVGDTRKALAELAAIFYAHPQEILKLIGITGTNGKTTTNYLIEYLLTESGVNIGRVGTTGASFEAYSKELVHTTPESSDLYSILRDFVDRGADAATLEVSSHALMQHRVDGLNFSIALFTNLSQDHLDYHGTLDEYIAAKRLLFSGLDEAATAIINGDDPHSEQLITSCSAKILRYGFEKQNDYRIKAVRVQDHYTHFELQSPHKHFHIKTNAVGLFNVYNLVCAFAAAIEFGADSAALIDAAQSLPTVPGRLELMHNQAPFKVFVDYAHTPDAIATVLAAIAEAYPNNNVISVFGCGGDRDKGKRPLMGEIATRMSTFSIITDDNPRSEKPKNIIRDIVVGCEGRTNYLIIQDRTEAVNTALKRAEPGDVIVILGKGHEPYQEVKGQRFPYSDMNVIDQFMEQNGYSA